MKRLLNVSVTILASWTVLLFLQSIQAYGLAVNFERITVDELKALLDNKADIVVVDVRDKDSYKASHIPGSISMAYGDEMKARHGELPQDKTIVLYCS
jgi:hypothetical protein